MLIVENNCLDRYFHMETGIGNICFSKLVNKPVCDLDPHCPISGTCDLDPHCPISGTCVLDPHFPISGTCVTPCLWMFIILGKQTLLIIQNFAKFLNLVGFSALQMFMQ